MFHLTFIHHRPDVHAQWVRTEHSAKRDSVFLCSCSKLLVQSPTACAVAIKLGGDLPPADMRSVILLPFLTDVMH